MNLEDRAKILRKHPLTDNPKLSAECLYNYSEMIMDKQAQVEELYNIILPSVSKYDAGLEELIRYISKHIIDSGYTRATPLVALDRDKMWRIFDAGEKILTPKNTSETVNLINLVFDRVCAKFGSPAARIPTEKQIYKEIEPIYMGSPLEIKTVASAIRKLCEELNKGE